MPNYLQNYLSNPAPRPAGTGSVAPTRPRIGTYGTGGVAPQFNQMDPLAPKPAVMPQTTTPPMTHQGPGTGLSPPVSTTNPAPNGNTGIVPPDLQTNSQWGWQPQTTRPWMDRVSWYNNDPASNAGPFPAMDGSFRAQYQANHPGTGLSLPFGWAGNTPRPRDGTGGGGPTHGEGGGVGSPPGSGGGGGAGGGGAGGGGGTPGTGGGGTTTPPGTTPPGTTPPGTTPGSGQPPASFSAYNLVSDYMNQLTDQNSPYMQNATRQGLEIAQQRGLLNSSIAAGNARRSSLDAAGKLVDQMVSVQKQRESYASQDWLNSNQFDREFSGSLALLPIKNSFDMLNTLLEYAASDPAIYTPDVINSMSNFFTQNMQNIMSNYFKAPGGA